MNAYILTPLGIHELEVIRKDGDYTLVYDYMRHETEVYPTDRLGSTKAEAIAASIAIVEVELKSRQAEHDAYVRYTEKRLGRLRAEYESFLDQDQAAGKGRGTNPC